jgi:hypothetical protein
LILNVEQAASPATGFNQGRARGASLATDSARAQPARRMIRAG